MDEHEKIFGLFAELGPVAMPEAVAVSEDPLTWTVLLPEAGVVTARLQPASHCVAFTVDVGPLPAEVPEAVRTGLLTGLLHVGYHWRESGTISAALDAEGEVSLVYRHPLATLDVQRLSSIVDKLGKLRSHAARALDEAAAAARTMSTPSADTAMPPGGIPV